MDSHNGHIIPSEIFAGIPSIPRVLLNLMEACRSPDFNPEKIVSIASLDMGLCCRILSMRPRTLDTETTPPDQFLRMVTELGPGGIRSIAVNAITGQVFSNPTAAHPVSLWKRSIQCARRARALAEQIGYPATVEAHLSGLLHAAGDPDPAGSGDGGFGLPDECLERCSLSPWMVDAIRYQREPVEQILDAHPLVRIVNLALRLDTAECRDGDPGYAGAEALLQIPRTTLHDLLVRVDEELARDYLKCGLVGNEQDSGAVNGAGLDMARQVRIFSLLTGADRDLAYTRDLAQWQAAVRRQMRLLFGLEKALIFRFDGNTNLLQAIDDSHSGADGRLWQISLGSGRTLVSETLLLRKPLDSFAQASHSSAPVADRQMIRMLGSEGLLAIPLLANGSRLGVIAAGVRRDQLDTVQKHGDLMADFSELAASGLQRISNLVPGGA